jgi:hypothetical protein
MRMHIFAGDGERSTTGAAERGTLNTAGGEGGNATDGPTASQSSQDDHLSYSAVRTRNDLAMLINQHEVKQEVVGEGDEEDEGDMDVEEGPVLYIGEGQGQGGLDDSFDVEMAELRSAISAGGGGSGGEVQGVEIKGEGE